jgi:hypothetical protein
VLSIFRWPSKAAPLGGCRFGGRLSPSQRVGAIEAGVQADPCDPVGDEPDIHCLVVSGRPGKRRLGKRYSPGFLAVFFMYGSMASRLCSVSSNLTGCPGFFCATLHDRGVPNRGIVNRVAEDTRHQWRCTIHSRRNGQHGRASRRAPHNLGYGVRVPRSLVFSSR